MRHDSPGVFLINVKLPSAPWVPVMTMLTWVWNNSRAMNYFFKVQSMWPAQSPPGTMMYRKEAEGKNKQRKGILGPGESTVVQQKHHTNYADILTSA